MESRATSPQMQRSGTRSRTTSPHMQRPTRSPSPHDMTLRAAASTVQRIWRGRKQRGVIDKWMEAVRQLRASYIDARAAAAGAKESPLYTDTALAAREALRGTLEVQAALEMAWHAVRTCVGRPDADFLKKEEYFTMTRKLYLCVKLEEADGEVVVSDVEEGCEEDWLADSKGDEELDEGDFKNCWFQLADGACASAVHDRRRPWLPYCSTSFSTPNGSAQCASCPPHPFLPLVRPSRPCASQHRVHQCSRVRALDGDDGRSHGARPRGPWRVHRVASGR